MQNVEPITTSDRVSKLLGIDLSAEVLAYHEQYASLPGAGGWRHVAEVLGTSKGAAYGMAHGTQSWTVGAAARWINHRHTNTLTVPACPDCGSVHHARCNGQPVAAVAVLAPGETVRRNGGTQRQRTRVRRPWMGNELSAEMDAAGVTDATVRWLVTRHIYQQELAECNAPGA